MLETLGWLATIGILFEGDMLDDEEPGHAQRLFEEALSRLDIVDDIRHLEYSLKEGRLRM
jgi:hypothetical protein